MCFRDRLIRKIVNNMLPFYWLDVNEFYCKIIRMKLQGISTYMYRDYSRCNLYLSNPFHADVCLIVFANKR